MRTTLTIDDDVLEAVKEIAAGQHRTAGAVLSDLARRTLAGRQEALPEDAPLAHLGFPSLPAGGKPVTDEDVERIREELGI